MKKDDHDALAMFITILIILVYIPSFVIGLSNARNSFSSYRCLRKWAKIEYLVPTFRLGCWVGTPFGEE